MNLKNLLKFSLCGGLLVGTAVAYATVDEQVTLPLIGENAKMSWDNFVAAINNPGSIVGNVPDDHDTKVTLKKAKDAQEAAEGKEKLANDTLNMATEDLGKEKATLAECVSDTVNKYTALTTAKTNLENAANSDQAKALAADTVAKKKAYNDSVAAIPVKENKIASLTTQQTKLNNEYNTAKTDLQTLKVELQGLQNQLAGLPKKTSTTTTIKPWLEKILNVAVAFNADYEAMNTESTQKMYYCEEVTTGTIPNTSIPTKTTKWYIAFGEKPSDGKSWTEASPVEFLLFTYAKDAQGEYTAALKAKPNATKLYLGADYNGTYRDLTISSVEDIISTATNTLQTMSESSTYTTTTTVTLDEVEEAFKAQAASLQAQIDSYTGKEATEGSEAIKGKIPEQEELIQSLNDQLNYQPTGADDQKKAGVSVQIQTLQDQIDTLKDETSENPNTLKNLKQAWDDAVVAYNNNLESAKTAITTAEENLKASKQSWMEQQGKVVEATEYEATWKKNVEDAEAAVAAAKTAVKEAEDAVAEAERIANDNAYSQYFEITLNEDVTANKQINFSALRINGNGHVITLTNDVPALFNSFAGTLHDVAVNGKVYNTRDAANAKTYNVAWWNKANATEPGRYYNDEGAYTTYSDLGALGFQAREAFGVDFDNQTLAFLTSESKVYNITIYEGPNSTSQKYAVVYEDQNGNDRFKGVNLPEEMENMFVESATADARDLNIPNLIYDGYKCDYVYISDKKQFYAPKDITAKTLVYDRVFKANKNATCLPFALKSNMDENINYLATFDTEDDNTIWFTKTENTIPANTPVLLNANKDFRFGDLSNVTIAQTPTDQKVIDEGSDEHASKSYGVFKSVLPGEIRGESNNNRIYGLFSGQFKNVSSTTKITPFRMVIYSTEELDPGINHAPRRIALKDEYGNVVDDTVTGVDSAAVTGLNIAGAQGQIVFTSDSNYGQVAIYNLEGQMVAIADVQEGTTSVNVAKGIYLVNGKKVMVK